MKKIFINNFKFFEFCKQNKLFVYHILIDLLFYLYISVGFILSAYFTYVYDFNTKLAAIIWTSIFLIIFSLKIKKDFKW